jgi:hypothetical protein
MLKRLLKRGLRRLLIGLSEPANQPRSLFPFIPFRNETDKRRFFLSFTLLQWISAQNGWRSRPLASKCSQVTSRRRHRYRTGYARNVHRAARATCSRPHAATCARAACRHRGTRISTSGFSCSVLAVIGSPCYMKCVQLVHRSGNSPMMDRDRLFSGVALLGLSLQRASPRAVVMTLRRLRSKAPSAIPGSTTPIVSPGHRGAPEQSSQAGKARFHLLG